MVIRGKDDLGKDLTIAQDYVTDAVRLRARERATLELGPETDLKPRQKLLAEVSAERFTRIDGAMIKEAAGSPLDLRPEAGPVRADCDRSFAPASATGLRGDIIKPMHRAPERRGEERTSGSFVVSSTLLT